MTRTLYRDAAITDARSPRLDLEMSVLVTNGLIEWIGPSDAEPDPGDAQIIDAGGTTIVPSMVDSHSHLSMPGGSHWIERGQDHRDELERVAEDNAHLLLAAGVRWVRDVGSPPRPDPAGGHRAMTLQVRDAWEPLGREVPYIRAAGTWLTRSGALPAGLTVEASDGDALVAAAMAQLADGADLVKLYLDGPDQDTAPWTIDEVASVVDAVHSAGAKVTAHATRLHGTRIGAAAAVDAIEHGFEIDATIAADMASNGVFLVSTLAVMSSWQSFATTTTIPRFTETDSRTAIAERLERGAESLRIARRAGVAIAAGTDFGGGSLRANQLAWEVEAMVEAGLEPWEALAAVTWRGGELLGEPSAGVIEVGGPSDFFLVHGDPLTDPSALWRVWRIA
ncbi:MAG: amidohydrolase family protein [Acidimicrobiia bacterium]|nr:amidohydrolase family protein [Acidimicrobiia bacterium]